MDIERFGIGSLGTGVLFLKVDGVNVVLEAVEGPREWSLFAGGSELWSSILRLRLHGLKSTSGIGVVGEGILGARYGGIESGCGSVAVLGEGRVKKGGEVFVDTGGEGRSRGVLNWGAGRARLRSPICV